MTPHTGEPIHRPEAPRPTSQRCDLPNGPMELMLYTGVDGCGAAHSALFDAVRDIASGTVFVAGPGGTASAAWAARSGAGVITWNDSMAEHLSIVETCRDNGLARLEPHVDWDFSALSPQSADLALLHLPRGRDVQAQLLRASAAMLRPGGSLALVGAKNQGVKAVIDDARRLFGLANVVSHKGGYHAALAAFDAAGLAGSGGEPHSTAAMPNVPFDVHTIDLDGSQAVVHGCAGVFASDRLDWGASALIRAMQVSPGEMVLDLGCGTGLVGLAALRRGATVTATDVSARAVASTRRTHAANGFPDTPVHLCIGASMLPASSLDVVLANPPFHRGHSVDFDVSKLFADEAARVLRPGGRLFLVANAFLNYRPWLAPWFNHVAVVQEDRHFKVWAARL